MFIPMTLPVPQSLSDRLSAILEGLYRAVAARIAGGGLAAAVIVLVCGRVRRGEGRIQRYLEQFRTGRLRVRAKPSVATAGQRRVATQPGVGCRLPRGFGWLLPLVPQWAAGYGLQLSHALEDAEMQALLAACPQARRVLAPICRMLAIAPTLLGTTARDVPPQATPDATVKPARQPHPLPIPKPQPAPKPLPRGLLAVARRQGFGKR